MEGKWKKGPEDIKRIDCVLKLGHMKFDVEIGVEEVDNNGHDMDVGHPVARTVHDGTVYRGAVGYGKLDAVRGLAYWLNECLSLEQDTFNVDLPISRDELREWRK